MTSVFDTSENKGATLFFNGGVDIARYDKVKYPFLEKLTNQQLGFFWRPERIDIVRDQADFKSLSAAERHIFTSNLKRQIVLDSVQGRAPAAIFLPICSQPELENWLITWSFYETIHSRSYTHIIRNVYAKPSQVFDEIKDTSEIMDCARDISKYYDELDRHNTLMAMKDPSYNLYDHKKALWLCLNAVNALEGVRFYISFACSWAFAEMKKMEGNANIIKEICRDENLHLASTQQIIKVLPKDDPDFAKIAEESESEVVQIFIDVIEQEKAWADYLCQYGAMLGLNADILKSYGEWIGTKRMTAIGLESPYKTGQNPLPWTQKWIAGSDVQVAPQEVQIVSYLEGAVKSDINENTFQGFEL
jgi:ribonucleoside-diphosphate reductase beta chain